MTKTIQVSDSIHKLLRKEANKRTDETGSTVTIREVAEEKLKWNL